MINVQALLQQLLASRMSPRPQLPGLSPQGGLAGFGGLDPRMLSQFGPQMMGQSSGPGPQVVPPVTAATGDAAAGRTDDARTVDPRIAQIAMGLMQRAQPQTIQFNPFMQFRGGR